MTTETPALVDALPFVDVLIDEDEKQRGEAMRLVDDELEIFPPARDYIDYLPQISQRPFKTHALEQEWERLEATGGTLVMHDDQMGSLAEIKTDIPTPAHTNMDEDELQLWRKCLDQVKIKLEYRQRQMVNLDLLKEYGSPAWERFIKHNETMEASMKCELDDLNNKIQAINSARKGQQETTLRHLNFLQSEWDNLSIKNEMLAEEIEKLRRK